MTRGTWTTWESRMHINILELQVVWRASHISPKYLLLSCPHYVRQHYHHLLHQQTRGACSRQHFVQKHFGCGISALPTRSYCQQLGTQNMIEDSLSRKFVTDHECELHDTVVSDVFDQWGTLIRDLFASHANSKCISYLLQRDLGTHSQGNALIIH